MSTASQVPQVPVPPPPTPIPAPALPQKISHRLASVSLVLGLIVVLPVLALLIFNVYGARIQLQSKVNINSYRLVLDYIFGLVGLVAMFTGVVSLDRMSKQSGQKPWFAAFFGITLGMCAFYYLLAAVTITYGQVLAQLIFVK